MASVLVRTSARREILITAVYLEEQGGDRLALRFLTAIESTFQNLALNPRMGKTCGFRRPALSRLRRWPVKDFENWLIFYMPKRGGVEVVHVLHGARDLETLLNDSPPDLPAF